VRKLISFSIVAILITGCGANQRVENSFQISNGMSQPV